MTVCVNEEKGPKHQGDLYDRKAGAGEIGCRHFLYWHIDDGAEALVDKRCDPSYRETVELLKPLVLEAMRSGREVKIPWSGGLKIRVQRHEDGYHVAASVPVSGEDTEVVTYGVSTQAGSGRSLWRALFEKHGLADMLLNKEQYWEDMPSLPWVLGRSGLQFVCLGLKDDLPVEELGKVLWWVFESIDRNSLEVSTSLEYWDWPDWTNPLSDRDDTDVCFDANLMCDPVVFIEARQFDGACLEQIAEGPARVGLFYRNRVMFVLLKFGEMPWMRMPFNMSLHRPHLWGLNLALQTTDQIDLEIRFDGQDRKVRSVRLPRQLSELFKFIIRAQIDKPIAMGDYVSRLYEIDSQYLNPESMVGAALMCMEEEEVATAA